MAQASATNVWTVREIVGLLPNELLTRSHYGARVSLMQLRIVRCPRCGDEVQYVAVSERDRAIIRDEIFSAVILIGMWVLHACPD